MYDNKFIIIHKPRGGGPRGGGPRGIGTDPPELIDPFREICCGVAYAAGTRGGGPE